MEVAPLASIRGPAARLVVVLGPLEESRRTTKRLVCWWCMCVCVCVCVCV